MRAPLEDSPDVLAHKAREIAATFGYPGKPADSAIWLEHRLDLCISGPAARSEQWDEWFAAEAPIRAIYRESPSRCSEPPTGRSRRRIRPTLTPGMVNVTLDGHGKLLNSPPSRSGDAGRCAIAPATVFRAAGSTPPLPRDHADLRAGACQRRHPRLAGTAPAASPNAR